jgi:hypothetical protein
MCDDEAVDGAATPSNPEGAYEPGEPDPRGRPGAWLRTLGESLTRVSGTPQAEDVCTVLKSSIQEVVVAAASTLDFDQRGFSDREQRGAARSVLRALLDVLPDADANVPPKELDIPLAATGDGWLTAVWVVIHASETVRFGSGEWLLVERLAPELDRRGDESFAEWRERRDELAARILVERRSEAGIRLDATRDLGLLVLRVFGSPVAAEQWMQAPHRLLDGSTPSAVTREGVDGIQRVMALLFAIEGSVYQ